MNKRDQEFCDQLYQMWLDVVVITATLKRRQKRISKTTLDASLNLEILLMQESLKVSGVAHGILYGIRTEHYPTPAPPRATE